MNPVEAEPDVLANREPGEDAPLLKDEDPPSVGAIHGFSLDEDIAPTRTETADNVQQCGLATA